MISINIYGRTRNNLSCRIKWCPFFNNISCLVILGMPGNEWKYKHSQYIERDMEKGSQTDVIELIYASFSEYNENLSSLSFIQFPELHMKAKAYTFWRCGGRMRVNWRKKMIVFECFRGLAWIVSRIQIIPLIRFKGYTAHKY